MQTFFKKVESFSTPAEVHWWTLRHVPDITPRGSQCIRAWKEVEDGWFLYSRSKSFLSSFFSRPVPSIYPAVPLPGFLSPPGKIAGSETWHGAAAGGGGSCRSLCCPTNGDGCGLRIVSWTASTTKRERGGGDPFLLHFLLGYRTPLMRGEGWTLTTWFERRKGRPWDGDLQREWDGWEKRHVER